MDGGVLTYSELFPSPLGDPFGTMHFLFGSKEEDDALGAHFTPIIDSPNIPVLELFTSSGRFVPVEESWLMGSSEEDAELDDDGKCTHPTILTPKSPSPLASPETERRREVHRYATMEVEIVVVAVEPPPEPPIPQPPQPPQLREKKRKQRNRPGKKVRQRKPREETVQPLETTTARSRSKTPSPQPTSRSRSKSVKIRVVEGGRRRQQKSKSRSKSGDKKRAPPKNVCHEWKQAGKHCTRKSPKHLRQFNHDKEWKDFYK